MRLEIINYPLFTIKKYHLIGLPLDGIIPCTFGAITLGLSKIRALNMVIFEYYKREVRTSEVMRKWKL